VCPLTKFPKSLILQHDGFHLSRAGHKIIGEAIAEAIVADVRARKERAGGKEQRQKAAAVDRNRELGNSDRVRILDTVESP
jgi:hypothetical protein